MRIMGRISRLPHATRLALRMAAAVLYVVLIAACDVGPSTPKDTGTTPREGDMPSLEDLVAATSSEGVDGVLRSGPLPASNGGPMISVSGDVVAVYGEKAFLNVTSDEPFTKLLVGLDGQDGYYELTLPARTLTIASNEDVARQTRGLFLHLQRKLGVDEPRLDGWVGAVADFVIKVATWDGKIGPSVAHTLWISRTSIDYMNVEVFSYFLPNVEIVTPSGDVFNVISQDSDPSVLGGRIWFPDIWFPDAGDSVPPPTVGVYAVRFITTETIDNYRGGNLDRAGEFRVTVTVTDESHEPIQAVTLHGRLAVGAPPGTVGVLEFELVRPRSRPPRRATVIGVRG